MTALPAMGNGVTPPRHGGPHRRGGAMDGQGGLVRHAPADRIRARKVGACVGGLPRLCIGCARECGSSPACLGCSVVQRVRVRVCDRGVSAVLSLQSASAPGAYVARSEGVLVQKGVWCSQAGCARGCAWRCAWRC